MAACFPGGYWDGTKEITVVSREDGSGTRGAFIELFGTEAVGEGGLRKDLTTKEAIITNKTDVMLSNIASDPYAIGYVSLGSLSEHIKVLSIDGVSATADNVKNGSYKVSRPFIIATKGAPEGLAKDFIDFIFSIEGQEVVSHGYVSVDDSAPAYRGRRPAGKITVAGSSSVTPVMEKLKEAYLEVNPNAVIEIQMSDSTAGMTAAIDGTCDIGMASRRLKGRELETLSGLTIALDGIAVIVNPNNPFSDMTSGQVKEIFTGKDITWNDVRGA
jgi:phosphate transport system substrate-binding protein